MSPENHRSVLNQNNVCVINLECSNRNVVVDKNNTIICQIHIVIYTTRRFTYALISVCKLCADRKNATIIKLI